MSQQVQFQARVAQDDVLWDAIRQPGLVVVDVHSSWCGPCTAIHSVFKRFFYEYSERNIKFFAADCDAIETLANFRGSSQSIFLFFVDGQLQETIFGVVMPEIVKNIKTMTLVVSLGPEVSITNLYDIYSICVYIILYP